MGQVAGTGDHMYKIIGCGKKRRIGICIFLVTLLGCCLEGCTTTAVSGGTIPEQMPTSTGPGATEIQYLRESASPAVTYTESNSMINLKCLSIAASPGPMTQLSGRLIFNSEIYFRLQGSEITKGILPLMEDAIYKTLTLDRHVSPNRKRLIYDILYIDKNTEGVINDELILWEQDLSVKKAIGYRKTDHLIGWFNNEQLLYNPTEPEQWKVNLVNPLTGETKQIPTNYPDLYFIPPMSPWFGVVNPVPVYDPTGTMAVYLRGSKEWQYALYDVGSQQLLWTKDVSDTSHAPLWSMDGERLALAVPQVRTKIADIYTINRNGEEMQLTDFESFFQEIYLGPISWSPDGRHIAFWISYKNPTEFEWEISVIDTTSGYISDYCIKGLATAPVWSPDGRQLAIGINNEKESRYSTVIIDIEKNQAFIIAEGMTPEGWME
jgi:hypothetical protein